MISKFRVKLNLAEPTSAGSLSIFKAGESEDNGVSFYEYDVWNQLKKTTEGKKTITYAYNGERYRVQKAVNGKVERYLYEADKVVLEVDGAGVQTAANVYGTNLVSRTAGEDTAYYLYNGHADVVALLDRAGATMATYYYDAFGNATEKTGTKDSPYRYAGYRYDEETDVYYLNARYYDAKIARFMTEDTYRGQMNDPLSLNLYTYVMNNPLMYIDPDGRSGKVLNNNTDGQGPASSISLPRGSSTTTTKPTASATPAPKPATKPTAPTTTKPTSQPVPKPTTKPAEKPATKPTEKTTTKPAEKPATKPAEKPTTKPETKPTEKPTTKPTEKTTTKPAEKTDKAKYPTDFQNKDTVQKAATFNSEREARGLAKTKLGKDPADIGDNKLRSQDGKWQYRAKEGDTTGAHSDGKGHIHLERLDPETGRVLENWHFYWK